MLVSFNLTRFQILAKIKKTPLSKEQSLPWPDGQVVPSCDLNALGQRSPRQLDALLKDLAVGAVSRRNRPAGMDLGKHPQLCRFGT